MRTARFQYSEWNGKNAMFYDHKVDPDENINQIENPNYAKAVQRLKGLLGEHREQL